MGIFSIIRDSEYDKIEEASEEFKKYKDPDAWDNVPENERNDFLAVIDRMNVKNELEEMRSIIKTSQQYDKILNSYKSTKK